MAEEEIHVFFLPDGRVEIQVCGVKGDKCLEVTKAVEEALGGKVERDLSGEYYEQPKVKTDDIQGLGY